MTEQHLVLDLLRASQIKHWLNCPQRAVYDSITPHNPRTDETKVGAVVGELVHQRITGHVPSEPRSITFDAQTPNEDQMERQIINMTKKIEYWLEKNEMEILEKELKCKAKLAIKNLSVELEGSIDAICYSRPEKTGYLIDFKTGAYMDSWYIQLAVYAYLLSKTSDDKGAISRVGYVYCPRRPRLTLMSDKISTRFWDFNDMAKHGRDYAIKAVRYATGMDSAHYNPSQSNCAYCRNTTCEMRYE